MYILSELKVCFIGVAVNLLACVWGHWTLFKVSLPVAGLYFPFSSWLKVIKNRFHRMFLPSHSLDTVTPTDLLLCFEVLSTDLAKERVVELQVQQVGDRNCCCPLLSCRVG